MGVSSGGQCRKTVDPKPLVAKSRVGRFAQRCILRVEQAVQDVACRVGALMMRPAAHSDVKVLERRLVQEIRAHHHRTTVIKVEPPNVVVVFNQETMPSFGVPGHVVKGGQVRSPSNNEGLQCWETIGHRLGGEDDDGNPPPPPEQQQQQPELQQA